MTAPEHTQSAGCVAGYCFRDPALLREALTHPSLAGPKNYQRLEFLGDRVLGLVIADLLYDRYPGEAEGRLNRRLSALVRGETVAKVAMDAGLGARIYMTEGAAREGAAEKVNVLADIGESVIGAIYLDGGLEAARTWIIMHWENWLDHDLRPVKDHKTRLQEWAQGRGLERPSYAEVGRAGPDHAPEFVIEVVLTGRGSARASGNSKRIAEQKAAEQLLADLEGKA